MKRSAIGAFEGSLGVERSRRVRRRFKAAIRPTRRHDARAQVGGRWQLVRCGTAISDAAQERTPQFTGCAYDHLTLLYRTLQFLRLMDVLALSRLQFGATISFHYVYPPLSIGLGVMLVLIESLWLWTRNPLYHQMARFWTRIFALTFAIGVATGIVMEFEFGTNWAKVRAKIRVQNRAI